MVAKGVGKIAAKSRSPGKAATSSGIYTSGAEENPDFWRWYHAYDKSKKKPESVSSPENSAVKGVSSATRAAGSMASASKKGSGTVPSPAIAVSKPTSGMNASIESLLRVAINHLSSIDETLKNQLDFDKSQATKELQTSREAAFEATPKIASLEEKPSAMSEEKGGFIEGLKKTALLAGLLSIPPIMDEIKGKFNDIKDMVTSPGGIAAAFASLAAAVGYSKMAKTRAKAVDAAPHTKESVKGEKGKAAVLTDAEKKRLKKENIKYNEKTGRYHEIKPDGKSGKMIPAEKVADTLNKTKPTTKLPSLGAAAKRLGGPLAAVGIESIDYMTGEKEATKENLAESAGGVGGGLAGGYAGAATGAALGTLVFPGVGTAIGGFVGGALGYLGGDILGRKAARAAMGGPTSPAGSVGVEGKKPKNKVSPQEIADYLKSKGVSDIHATGMIVNIAEESGFDSAAIGDNGKSGGLFQHYDQRFDAMRKFAGEDWDKNWKKQIDYALSEPDSEKYLSQSFSSPGEAAAWFLKNWERPAAQHVAKRMQNIDKHSEGVMNSLFGKGGQMVAQGGGGAAVGVTPGLPTAGSKADAITPPVPTQASSTPSAAPAMESAQAMIPSMNMGNPSHPISMSKGTVPTPGMDTSQDWALYFNVT